MSPGDISCQATPECVGHAMLPGGELLIIDGKRHCWGCASKVKKQKDKCVRVPMIELQTALDLLNAGIKDLDAASPPEMDGFNGPTSLVMARQILHELLEEKGSRDG